MMLPKLALRKRKIISLSCFILALLVVHNSSRAGNNYCSLGDVYTIDDNSFSVEIIVTNDDTLAGFQIPFAFDYGDIEVTCDSISYAGGNCEDFASQAVIIENEANRAFLATIQDVSPEDGNYPLNPGAHVVALAYFTMADVDPNRSLTFEESAIPDEHRDYSLLMWTPAAEEVQSNLNFESLLIQ